MAHVAVTAVGVDRPGIVADVSGALFERGANLEDTSMTILRGHFSMVLVVAVPDDADVPALEAALAAAAPDLVVTVRPLAEDVGAPEEGDRWTVSVHGADRPGMVYGVARLLADRGVNVVDLRTRVIGAADRPVYAMLLDVTLPAGVDAAELDAALHDLAAGTGIDCTLHPADADIL